MPHYEIHHSCELETAQYQRLTELITNLHSTLFAAPTCFVNVTFHCTNNCYGKERISMTEPYPVTYAQYMAVGGRRVWTNYIIGHLRPRAASPEHGAKLEALVEGIKRAWNTSARPRLGLQSLVTTPSERCMRDNEAVWNAADPGAPGRLDDPRALHNVFVMEDIVAGMEQGFMLPRAGQDSQWVEKNLEEIKKRAGSGDVAMQDLVMEYQRGLGKGLPAGRSKL